MTKYVNPCLHKKLDEQTIKEICEMYDNKTSLTTIARHFQTKLRQTMSTPTIIKIIKANHLQIRPKQQRLYIEQSERTGRFAHLK